MCSFPVKGSVFAEAIPLQVQHRANLMCVACCGLESWLGKTSSKPARGPQGRVELRF